jgi:hypothetical protein
LNAPDDPVSGFLSGKSYWLPLNLTCWHLENLAHKLQTLEM